MQDNLSDAARFIIRTLADDYESIETLVNYYKALATPAFSRSEVNRTLVDLVADEYVQPYLYSESDKKFAPSQFLPAASGQTWFGLTIKGRELLRGIPWFTFNPSARDGMSA